MGIGQPGVRSCNQPLNLICVVDNDARMKIHREDGTKKLFEWYLDMEKVVQLETLAALVCGEYCNFSTMVYR